MSNLLVAKASVFERVELLEKSIYDQGSLLFGFLLRKEKKLRGLNRRAHFIKLLKEKNELLARNNSTSDQCTRDSFTVCCKTFAQDFVYSSVVSLAEKVIGK